MYTAPPSSQELELLGLLPEDVANNDDTEVFPDNWLPFLVFDALFTQWKGGGMGGVTGLDYSAIPVVLDLFSVESKEDKQDVFQALRLMENEALKIMNSKD